MKLHARIFVALTVAALAGCKAAPRDLDETAAAAGVDRIEIRDNAFDPAVIEVPAGTTVTWVFADNGRAHNVVGQDFESEVLSDGIFTHKFTAHGSYDYTSTLHSGMDGRVVVAGRA